ncbi:hypothetical protein TRFO_37224 [Tritrichomonas foetus]|uniref:Micro-fibrillar-associated protein 1 C-terminal domain-containing protein n=1 Tax=Tritrichomonas foetus TaxID=1144522 RepID=A0A1J4JE76_9EUKA|nr:hypothetical protein TRFO_37224 [Tritrichomonas foetus]|eukprot:OHS96591.1 hypothetical protein TRFO_37224 [Tritrichomonas foetus]
MSDYDYSYSDDESIPDEIDISFVCKNQRNTLQKDESSSSENEEEIKKRKKDSKRLAKEAANRIDTESEDDIEPWSEPQAPDTNDATADPEEEYKLWVEREVSRLRAEITVGANITLDQARTRQQKLMSDAELAQLKAEKNPKKKEHMQFMQKYFHKGAFTIAEDNPRAQELLQRNYNTPVGEDLYDKKSLPAEMVVRGDDYQKKGRTKWTHLLNEDTTTLEMRNEARKLKKKEDTSIPDVHKKKKGNQ